MNAKPVVWHGQLAPNDDIGFGAVFGNTEMALCLIKPSLADYSINMHVYRK